MKKPKFKFVYEILDFKEKTLEKYYKKNRLLGSYHRRLNMIEILLPAITINSYNNEDIIIQMVARAIQHEYIHYVIEHNIKKLIHCIKDGVKCDEEEEEIVEILLGEIDYYG